MRPRVPFLVLNNLIQRGLANMVSTDRNQEINWQIKRNYHAKQNKDLAHVCDIVFDSILLELQLFPL